MSEFDQKVIVITGAAGNLGLAVAQAFARQSAHLALNAESIASEAAHCVTGAAIPVFGQS